MCLKKIIAASILASILLLCISARICPAAHDASWYGNLEKKVNSVANDYAGRMSIGVSFFDISEGASFDIHGDEPYPLASVFKVPIMIAVMKRVDRGDLRLSDQITVRERDKCIGSGSMSGLADGSRITVQKCIDLMITVSDNTATDLLWNLAGNDGVNDLMKTLSLTRSNIYIPNRPGYLISLGMGSEFHGKSPHEIAAIWKKKSLEERKKSMKSVLDECSDLSIQEFQAVESASESQQAGAAYYDDVKVAEVLDNYSSPNDMAQLLLKLHRGEILGKSSTNHCLNVLSRQKYNSRIPRLLPGNVKVYHKTGTICGVVNDMGIVQISKSCPIVLVVFVKQINEGRSQEASTAIARISKSIYDYYCRQK